MRGRFWVPVSVLVLIAAACGEESDAGRGFEDSGPLPVATYATDVVLPAGVSLDCLPDEQMARYEVGAGGLTVDEAAIDGLAQWRRLGPDTQLVVSPGVSEVTSEGRIIAAALVVESDRFEGWIVDEVFACLEPARWLVERVLDAGDTPWDELESDACHTWPGRPNCEPVGEVRVVQERDAPADVMACGTERYYDDVGEAAVSMGFCE